MKIKTNTYINHVIELDDENAYVTSTGTLSRRKPLGGKHERGNLFMFQVRTIVWYAVDDRPNTPHDYVYISGPAINSSSLVNLDYNRSDWVKISNMPTFIQTELARLGYVEESHAEVAPQGSGEVF